MQILKKCIHSIIDLIYAKCCLYCRAATFDANNLCLDCLSEVTYITEPRCYKCSEPFIVDYYKHFDCRACSGRKYHFDSARALFAYEGVIRELIHQYKFEGKTHLAQFFARLLQANCGDIFHRIDYIIPVPTHKDKVKQRGFCHTTMLAKKIAKLTGVPLLYDGLLKCGDASKQHSKTREERMKQIRGSFKLNKTHKKVLYGKSVLLVDDVITTGATASEAARALARHCRGVKVLAIAKTLLG